MPGGGPESFPTSPEGVGGPSEVIGITGHGQITLKRGRLTFVVARALRVAVIAGRRNECPLEEHLAAQVSHMEMDLPVRSLVLRTPKEIPTPSDVFLLGTFVFDPPYTALESTQQHLASSPLRAGGASFCSEYIAVWGVESDDS